MKNLKRVSQGEAGSEKKSLSGLSRGDIKGDGKGEADYALKLSDGRQIKTKEIER